MGTPVDTDQYSYILLNYFYLHIYSNATEGVCPPVALK